ncbi:unnamed protein product [Acanthosepion pharaonis]|uniref:Uncharacterized protein n=1 Tax=Acanthosepion pharaonis TaxID=158019 RepID=A0A812EAM7_ACAPH|nr:unnamed protein product [Sepia pharaonis]
MRNLLHSLSLTLSLTHSLSLSHTLSLSLVENFLFLSNLRITPSCQPQVIVEKFSVGGTFFSFLVFLVLIFLLEVAGVAYCCVMREEGCGHAIVNLVEQHLLPITGIVIAILALQLFGFLFIVLLICYLRKPPPQQPDDVVYEMARTQEKAPYPTRGNTYSNLMCAPYYVDEGHCT